MRTTSPKWLISMCVVNDTYIPVPSNVISDTTTGVARDDPGGAVARVVHINTVKLPSVTVSMAGNVNVAAVGNTNLFWFSKIFQPTQQKAGTVLCMPKTGCFTEHVFSTALCCKILVHTIVRNIEPKCSYSPLISMIVIAVSMFPRLKKFSLGVTRVKVTLKISSVSTKLST